jgi:hypothetical protein
MKKLILLTICLAAIALHAQESQVISTGPGYNKQSYVNVTAGTQHQVANTAWDIAFTVAAQDAGVFINESVGSATDALPVQAYYTYSDDFNLLPDSTFFEQYPLLNRETSWSYGAFNEFRDGGNPNDFGWGLYNPGTQQIDGSYVYVIKQRDGSYLKFQIQSLINGVYTFRYANMDGSGEVTKTIAKADHAGKVLAYFSFDTGATVDVEPAEGFDLLYCRYTTLLDAGGDTVPYLVTGILSAAGTEVAQAGNVDPETVHFEDYLDSLSSNPEIIGYDWKTFDLGNFVWVLPTDLVYFVKTRYDHIWKLQFIDFAGSNSGNATFEKTDLGIISAVPDPWSPLSTFQVYPNPAIDEINVLFSLKNNPTGDVKFQILDAHGRLMNQYVTGAGEGLNVYTIHRNDLITGIYFIRLMVDGQSFTGKVCITR